MAKRYGAEARIDDRTFILAGDGAVAGALDHGGPKVAPASSEVAALFKGVNAGRGDHLVVFGWAMAEDLASGKLAAGRSHR